MPSKNVGNFTVVDAKMRSTGNANSRRYATQSAAETAAKRLLDSSAETSPVFVAKLVSKVEAPQSHRVTPISH